MALASKRMRFSALGRGITDGEFEDVGGGVFRSGASSSLRREEGLETFLLWHQQMLRHWP